LFEYEPNVIKKEALDRGKDLISSTFLNANEKKQG